VRIPAGGDDSGIIQQGSAFQQGDALWSSLTQGIQADLKQSNGGKDVASVPDATTYRPDWDEIAKLYDNDPDNDAAVLNSIGCDSN
jgi:hypothetical protein